MHFAVVALSLLAVLIVLLGLVAMIRTQTFRDMAEYFVNPRGVWIAAGIRLFAAVMLWFAAPASRYPVLFKVFAGVALFAAVAVLIVGDQRIRRIVEWAIDRPPWVLRLWAALAMFIGGFVLWALWG